MHRLFVAVRPPEAVRDRLIDRMDDGVDVRWQSESQLHLTLRFVGPVERPVAAELATALANLRFAPFALRLAGVGRFDRRGGGALWAAVAPREPVSALARKIERLCQSIGLEPERRAFHPHITMARWSGRRSHEAEAFVRRNSDLSSDPFTIDRFTLFESHLSRHGAHYEPVEDYPATAAPVD